MAILHSKLLVNGDNPSNFDPCASVTVSYIHPLLKKMGQVFQCFSGSSISIHWGIQWPGYNRCSQMGRSQHLSCVFFVVWVRLLLCCLRHCLRNAYAATAGAYAAHTFEGVPTQAQRPHKATPQCIFLPTPSHFCLLLEGWKRNFCLRDHSSIHIFAARAPRLQSAHRHLAATPMCSSRTSNQVPKRTLNIWWINHDKSLKTQLVTFDYAGVKPSDVFDCR